jgi:amino acid adenylation domain-containing protein
MMNMLMQHGMQAQAQARPEANALVLGRTRMSYGALDQASNRLAHQLAGFGCRRGDRVALLMPKTPMAIVAMLATLKLGAIYVPLDPGGPVARLALMLAASECRVVLAAGNVAPLLERALPAAMQRLRPAIGWLDETAWNGSDLTPAFVLQDLAALPPSTPACRCTDGDAALILFTSGSTGQPKGVTITHRNVMSFLRWAVPYFGINAADRLSQHAPLRFDISTFDIYAALSTGAELHLVPAELNLLPHRLAQLIRDAKLTQWFCVPSTLNLMAQFDVVRHGDFPSLRRVLFAGEVLPTPTLIHWMERLPHASFSNLYGPTETTISSSCYTVPRCPTDRRAPIPIGTACDGEELLVLDGQLRPVPDGQTGELYIRGAGLSPGYWRDPEKTREAFLPTPAGFGPDDRIYKTGDLARRGPDGLVYYLGRTDMQIKSRGYRIELGEVEMALHSLPFVRDGAVVAIDSGSFEGSLICCAYVPVPGRAVSPKNLRSALAQLLPGYMLPARWMLHEVLPTNGSGKTDRLLLKQAFLLAESRRPKQAPKQELVSTSSPGEPT